jgi:hypothetical protein
MSINSMSFCPSESEIKDLCKHSDNVSIAFSKGDRGLHISKLYMLPPKYGLFPDTGNPEDTILSKLGKSMCSINDPYFAVIGDKYNMPYGHTSCGPNGVLHKCHDDKYGPNRLNTFHKDKETTLYLLNDYIKFRNDNIKDVFQLFFKALIEHDITYLLDGSPGKTDTLDPSLHSDYSNVCEMFKILQNEENIEKTLEDKGIGVVSFFQTYIRSGGVVGKAQQSVTSPHWQTRFYITDDSKLIECGIDNKHIKSYIKIITNFTDIMCPIYGQTMDVGQAFINADLLLAYLLK